MPTKKSPKLTRSRAEIANRSSKPKEERIDTIRDLLFGEQSEYFETKIDDLKQSLDRDMESLQSTLSERVTSLEQFVKNEFKNLNNKLSAETKNRTKANAQIVDTFSEERGDLKKSTDMIEKALRKSIEKTQLDLSRDVTKKTTALEKQLDKQALAIQRELAQKVKNLEDSVALQVTEKDLAAAFGDISNLFGKKTK